MFRSFSGFFAFFFSPWGLLALAALDSSVFFFAPLANDVALIMLTARSPDRFWLFALIAVAGSLIGSATTYFVGTKIGDAGLERMVSSRRLARVRERVGRSGALALALPALIPPPFPYTPIVLACGALHVEPRRFFAFLAVVRLVRFGTEAVLARAFGRRLLVWMDSDVFQIIIGVFIVGALAGTVYSIRHVVRGSRAPSAGRARA